MLKVNPHILTTLCHRFDEQVSEADIEARGRLGGVEEAGD